MALFSVTRYMGDDEEGNESSTNRADSILQKLQTEAKIRKLQRRSGDDTSPQVKPTSAKTEKQKDKKKHNYGKGAVKTEAQTEDREDISVNLLKLNVKDDRHCQEQNEEKSQITATVHDLGPGYGILQESAKKKRKKKKTQGTYEGDPESEHRKEETDGNSLVTFTNLGSEESVLDKSRDKKNRKKRTGEEVSEAESPMKKVKWSEDEIGSEEKDQSPVKNKIDKVDKVDDLPRKTHLERKEKESTDDKSDEGISQEEQDVISPQKHKNKKKKNTKLITQDDVVENDSLRITYSDVEHKEGFDDTTDEGRFSQGDTDVSSPHKPKKKKKKKGKLQTEDKSEVMNNSVDNGDKSDLEESQMDSMMEEDMNNEEVEPVVEGSQEIGGFTVLGDIKPKKTQKVHRVLPDWLANPDVIAADLRNKTLSFSDVQGLDPDLITKLRENGITSFFPVQMQVIPHILKDVKHGVYVGPGGLRPRDVCVSAPTGSGKTLAFVLPIVQALKKRLVCQVRALAVLPVRDLATQVYKVFQTYCKGTSLKVGLLVGQKPFENEQQSLVIRRFTGYDSLVDIIVATPGRLVDHINKTEGFDLTGLRFLVIDEADRMMEEIKQDWLSQVEGAVYRESKSSTLSGMKYIRERPGPLTVASVLKMQMPLQKMLFSATLSQNPEKLQQLNLFQPKLFTSVVTATKSSVATKPTAAAGDAEEHEEMGSPAAGEFVGKYTTPTGLTEYVLESSTAEKPLMVLHFLHNLKFRHVLCFTNSVEATHRLYWLVKLMGNIEVREFSSGQHSLRRDKILKQFEAGKIDIIICSDAMARGMDVQNVKYVISYDPPSFIKTYIHRIGRTARAGKTGSAITLLQKKEFYHFKKMVKEAGKSSLQTMKVNKESLKPMIPTYQDALKELPKVLKGEKMKGKSAR